MFNLMKNLKQYIKREDIIVDNPVFRIHCNFTVVLLMTFSMIITWTQFVGQPIRCIVEGIPTRVLNTYCWIMTTYTMPDAFYRPSSEIAHPGIANNDGNTRAEKHYTYYQWVCFVLFFQALLCYVPKWLWEHWENGLMKTIVCGLNIGLRTEEEKKVKKSILIDYLVKHMNHHNTYTLRYWFCEFLCFVNIIGQMFLMDWFFKGDFMTYGLNVLFMDDTDQEDRYDHMVYVFPRVTKCTFRKFGPSSNIETHDALCILPLNIVNEKTYIFLWFWFIILALLTGMIIILRLIVLLVPSLRSRLMYARDRMVPKYVVESVTKRLSVGDWWVLYMLGRNIDPHVYKEVITEFAKRNATTEDSYNPKMKDLEETKLC